MIEKSTFKFLGYKIPKVEMSVADDFCANRAEQIEIIDDFSLGYGIDPEEPRLVEVLLTVKLKDKNEKFSFIVQIKGGFMAHKDMPEELFKNLYTKNAPAILYPYARAIVSNYMVLANIPPYLLPLINLTKNEEAEKIEKK